MRGHGTITYMSRGSNAGKLWSIAPLTPFNRKNARPIEISGCPDTPRPSTMTWSDSCQLLLSKLLLLSMFSGLQRVKRQEKSLNF